MKRHFMRNLLAAWMMMAAGVAWAAIPTGYYNSLSNKSG